MEQVKKWFSDLKSEIPIFVHLCGRCVAVLKSWMRKDDATAIRAEIVLLQRQSRKMQVAVGVVIAIFVIAALRGCGRSDRSTGIGTTDADMRRYAMEQVERERRRSEEIEARQKQQIADAEKQEAARQAASELLRKKSEELNAWYRNETKKLEDAKKIEYERLVASMKGRTHQLVVEKGWPQIRIDPLDGIALGEPVPESLIEIAKARTEMPLKNPLFGGLTSMSLETHSPILQDTRIEPYIVHRIDLNGKLLTSVPNATKIVAMLTEKLDQVFGTKHNKPDGFDRVEENFLMLDREWTGLPRWEARLQVEMDLRQDRGGPDGSINLRISGRELCRLVEENVCDIWNTLLKQHEHDFKAKKEQLEQEFLRRQHEMKGTR